MSADPAASPTNITVYDVVPYPTASYPQSSPNRIAAMARMFGVPAASPAKARVLELGCADGANLLPLAEQYPEASFLGVDSSANQIAAGQRTQKAAGLKNVVLQQLDVLQFPESAGEFDYIIAHGLFSWAPEPVREKILAICAAHLAPQGVVYVSYNALPGWNMRRSLRDVMRYHTRLITEPKAKVLQARAVLKFLADSVPVENNAYGILLRGELQYISSQEDNHLLHEYLLGETTPFYFQEFVGRAARHKLQYLAESNVAQMLASNFPAKVRETLDQLGNNLIAQEQYMDFLRNRAYRETLLCRGNVSVNRSLAPVTLRQLAFQPLFNRATGPVDLNPGVKVDFITISGVQVSTDDPFVKAVFHRLAEVGPAGSISYQDLLETARARSRPFMAAVPADRDAVDEATLDNNLTNLFAKGLVEILADAIPTSPKPADKPLVGALARDQAVHARLISNRLHQPAPADVIARLVIEVCDGTRTREDILAVLLEKVKEGRFQIMANNEPLKDAEKTRSLLSTRLDAVLVALGEGGFFAP